jgi:hypothetical protein
MTREAGDRHAVIPITVRFVAGNQTKNFYLETIVKNFTITTTGRLAACLLLSYRTPAHLVRHLVPRGLDLVTRGGFAFWNVVACRVEAMRPAGLPACCGVSYNHVGYRLHVQARADNGAAPLRGLYFVRSDADSALVGGLGNLLSDFHFHPADVELSSDKGVLTLAVQGHDEEHDPRDGEGLGDAADAIVRVAVDGAGDGSSPLAPPPGSPCQSAADAERVLKYAPLGLSVDLDGRYVKLAEVLRDEAAWSEKPVRVIESHFRFFDRLGLGREDVQLERATRVAPIDYRWKLGRRIALLSNPVPPVTGHIRPAQPARAAA